MGARVMTLTRLIGRYAIQSYAALAAEEDSPNELIGEWLLVEQDPGIVIILVEAVLYGLHTRRDAVQVAIAT